MITEKEIEYLRWREADKILQDIKEHLSAVIISRASVGVFPMLISYGVDIPSPIDDKSRFIVRALINSLREGGFAIKTNKSGLILY